MGVNQINFGSLLGWRPEASNPEVRSAKLMTTLKTINDQKKSKVEDSWFYVSRNGAVHMHLVVIGRFWSHFPLRRTFLSSQLRTPCLSIL